MGGESRILRDGLTTLPVPRAGDGSVEAVPLDSWLQAIPHRADHAQVSKRREKRARRAGAILSGRLAPGEEVRDLYLDIAGGPWAWQHRHFPFTILLLYLLYLPVLGLTERVAVDQGLRESLLVSVGFVVLFLAPSIILSWFAATHLPMFDAVVTDRSLFLIRLSMLLRAKRVAYELPLQDLRVEPHPRGRADAFTLHWSGGSLRMATWLSAMALIPDKHDAARLASDLRSLPGAAEPATLPVPSN